MAGEAGRTRSVHSLRWLLAALCATAAAVAQAQTPILDLDTGGHRAKIRGLATDAAGTTLLTVSDDKTARVWDLETGQTARVLRGYVGPGSDGQIAAGVLSPDGRYAAVAGYFGPHLATDPPFGDVRVFDTRSGRIADVLRGHPWVVDALAYAPERDELAAAGQGGVVHRWRAPFSGAAEALEPLDSGTRRILGLGYAAGGTRLAAASLDWGLRLWDAETGTALDLADPDGLATMPLVGLAVSADGAHLALAGRDGGVEVRRAVDGARLATLPPRPFRPDALAFTGDGATLAVGCADRCGGVFDVETWDWAAARLTGRYAGHDGAVSAALPLPGGALATAGGHRPEVHLWRPGDAAARRLTGIGAPVTAVGLSPDAGTVAWGTGDPCPAQGVCPMTLGSLTRALDLPLKDRGFGRPRPVEAPDRFVRAALSAGPVALGVEDDPGDGFTAAILTAAVPDGRLRVVRGGTDGYYHAAATLVPGRGEVLSGGGNGVLLAYDLAGRVRGEYVGHRGDVLALAVAGAGPEDWPAPPTPAAPPILGGPDGPSAAPPILGGPAPPAGAPPPILGGPPPAAAADQVPPVTGGRLLSGAADQTMILWDLDTRQVIVRMFFAGADWIVWTPEGYFHASPNGDRLVGWQINRGRDAAARWITARQLRQHLHSPEIVRRAILTGDSAAAARDLRGRDDELGALLTRDPPAFEIRLAEELDLPDGVAAVEIVGPDLEELESWGTAVLVNDRRVPPRRLPDPEGRGRAFYQVPLEPGANAITVSGEDGFGYITERAAVALSTRAPPPAKGRLFVAVVGVNDYPNLPMACAGRSCDLAYPVIDAVEFLATMAEVAAPLYSGMETLVLLPPDTLEARPDWARRLSGVVPADAAIPPEAAAIEDELAAFLARPGPDDTTILFVAGHGINLGEDYFFIPSDGAQRDSRWRKRSLVDWAVVQEEIGFAVGRRILFVDTCHAAGAFNARLEKDAADARVIVLSATAPNSVAQERRDLGHGLFTYAVLEGLRGRADSGDGVRLLGLADHVDRQVRALSDERQAPFFHISQSPNILLARP
ncbi:hypothetical protein DXV76_03455 [Rhodobacteraceae bacterium CCMM004]|nr:hypothetical protein DXV76_03455 [Rhodobacteraceae bacterium CCMM004]